MDMTLPSPHWRHISQHPQVWKHGFRSVLPTVYSFLAKVSSPVNLFSSKSTESSLAGNISWRKGDLQICVALCQSWTNSFFFFFFTSLLEYNCFTMVCQFLLSNKVNQLYMCPHISSLLHLPPSHPPYPTPLGGHKAPSWSPSAMRLLPTSYVFYLW